MKALNIFGLGLILVLSGACESMLDTKPQGVVADEDLNEPEQVEKMINAAYSFVGQNHFNKQMGMPYEEGTVRGGEAYKGGSGTNDNAERNRWETFTYMQPTNVGDLDNLWWVHYVAVGRVHDALRRVKNLTAEQYPLREQRIAELRFLRGHIYMYMKQCFKFFPYIDEDTPQDMYDKVSNDALSDQELWGKLIEDFRFAAGVLPDVQAEVGRPTGFAAKAYLAKTLIFAAYEQDDNHNVININREKLTEVAALCKDIIDNSGKHLAPDFAENFLCEYENGTESIWAIQYTTDSQTGRLNSWLVSPVNSDYGCCGFLQPSVNMMNRYKTVNGVPDFENFNTGILLDNKDAFAATPMDPRLMHTAAVPGMPWKYAPSYIMGENWVRTPEVYGYSMSQKLLVSPTSDCFKKTNPFMGAGLNWDVLRLDEVMLWRAEALIQLEQEMDEALRLINEIRERAANSTDRLKFADGTPTGRFDVQPYRPGLNCPAWTKEFALRALRWERHLEFATEGKWFFDLVRWGIAAEYMNAYFNVEKTRRSYLRDANFTKNRDEYFPIPEVQISYVKGLYKQNAGW
ncbi:RagB/SusD family nutrient uptake outer membrane protein [Parapedobacter indicus]|uniref:Starch-binding associating with outer membrane n=1 Tax=Parapedobacter indicus TaxID=1477437 RepID=A0A1I3IMU8_9SPHI|nr:RagB/SusD family nutrient uptake outer membrane protein [Parapedobacter indicus]PPL02227.1 putative outer membrane starch-binding protein [Parapedobacter indicus]SFI49157.1 Starch-binding associating with outer membrane [Parapedobacter indicus]